MPKFVQFTAIRANAKIIPGPAIRAALDAYTLDFCADIVIATSPYPPVPATPTNRYERTGRLLRNWRVRPLPQAGGNLGYQIDNPTQDRWGRYYGGFVHGPSDQTSFHAAHGWENIGDHIDRAQFREGAQEIIQAASGAL